MRKLFFTITFVTACCYCCAQITKTIEVKKPGTLEEVLTDDEKEKITELTITGKLNSSDVKVLRRMAGATDETSDFTWKGNLKKLDLSKASCVDDNHPYLKIPVKKSYKITRNVSENMTLRNRKTGEIIVVNRDQLIDNMSNSNNLEARLKADELTTSGTHEYVLGRIDDKEWHEIEKNKWNVRSDQWIEREKSDTVVYYMFCHTAENHISSHMFYKCENLESIILCDNTKRISHNALSGCYNLEDIMIPKKVISVHKNAFKQLINLKTVYISKKSECKQFKQNDSIIKSRLFKQSPNLIIERY